MLRKFLENGSFGLQKVYDWCYMLWYMERRVKIAPSVLSADFSDMRGALRQIDESTAPWVHLDVMDGSFVPNITFGPKFIQDARPHSSLFFDTHLMIDDPIRYVEQFVSAGSQAVTVHYEACEDAVSVLRRIRDLGSLAGISIRPATDVELLGPILDEVDLVLVMSVNPGFGGQSFIHSSLDKVKWLVRERRERRYLVSIDGGINEKTMPDVYEAGVDAAVTGSAFFKASDKRLFVDTMSVGMK